MKSNYEQALSLLDAFEQVEGGMLLQAYAIDTPEKFRALRSVKVIRSKAAPRASALYRWGAVAACLAVILALAVSPWVFSTLIPTFIKPTEPTYTTQPTEPPTTGFTEIYDPALPPRLLAFDSHKSLWPVMTGYNWTYYPEVGTSIQDSVESPNPLSAELEDAIPWLTTDESYLALRLEDDCDSITIRCWESGNIGNPDAYEEYQIATCVNRSVRLKPGSYIYEVTAEWYPYRNIVTYIFGVTADFETHEPERSLEILCGDMALRNVLEFLNQGCRYDDAAQKWVDASGSGGYWMLYDAATNGTTVLPTLRFDGELQVAVGPNGTLTDIRVYFSRDDSDPGVYMFAESTKQLSDLPVGQWYILMCITWQGRYIESEATCESYDYEYVFMLEVPEPATPAYLWDFDENSGTLTVSGCEILPDFSNDNQWKMPPWASIRDDVKHIVVADGVERIGNYAFYDMPNLQTVTFPDSLREIGDFAFWKAEKLTGISLPASLKKIGDYAFDECKMIPEIILPEGLESIGEAAFRFCPLPTSLTIPSTVTTIGSGAFRYMNGLQEVTILGSPKSMRFTFNGCEILQVIRFCGDAPINLSEVADYGCVICYYPAQNATWTEEILDTANLYYTVWFASEDPEHEQITENATSGQCGRTAYWELKDEVLIISGTGDITFIGWENYRGDIQKVIIDDGITNIVDAAFFECVNLTSVTIPKSVTSIGSRAFYNCYTLKAVMLPEDLEYLGDYAFMHCESITTITIPESLSQIPRMAFCGCKSLKEVNFPSGLTTIIDAAFQNCTSLKEIHFPASLTSLGDYAFSGCSSLKKIYFYGDVPGVGNFTFEGVTGTAYYPPGNVSWISGGMKFHSGNITEKPDPNQCAQHQFGDWMIIQEPTPLEKGTKQRSCNLCGYKETDTVPPTEYDGEAPEHPELGEPIAGGFDHNVQWNLYADGTLTIFGTGIMEEAFQHIWIENHRAQIKQLIIEEGLASIASTAFCGLPNLVEVQLPNTLMRIGVYAFSGCIQLKSIMIPASVVEIQNYAFGRCDALRQVYFLGDAPDMPNNIFNMDTLYVYIPANNKTWSGRMWDYGGKITWVTRDSGAGQPLFTVPEAKRKSIE